MIKSKHIGFIGSLVILVAAIGNRHLENMGYVIVAASFLQGFTTYIAFFKK